MKKERKKPGKTKVTKQKTLADTKAHLIYQRHKHKNAIKEVMVRSFIEINRSIPPMVYALKTIIVSLNALGLSTSAKSFETSVDIMRSFLDEVKKNRRSIERNSHQTGL